jgi:hypothetical protein
MHHHHHGHFGPRRFGGRRFPNRQELLARLESHQRDLEQELADVADLIAHLRDKGDAPQPEQQ